MINKHPESFIRIQFEDTREKDRRPDVFYVFGNANEEFKKAKKRF